jgi:hypothetical protein
VLGPFTPGEIALCAGNGICLLVALWTRAAVAELRASITEKQEVRCRQCRKELVSRRELEPFKKFAEEAHG